jgi:hypothetical protein
MAASRAAREGVLELGDVRALDELAARLQARDDVFGCRKDSRSVARDGR